MGYPAQAASPVIEATDLPDDGRIAMRNVVPHATVRQLSAVSTQRGLLQVGWDFGSVFLFAALCENFWHPALYLAAVIWIGSRSQALGVLGHDAIHYALVKSKRLNNILGEMIFFVIFQNFNDLRKVHWAHHRHLNTDKDPDAIETYMPASVRTRYMMLLMPLLGLGLPIKTWMNIRSIPATVMKGSLEARVRLAVGLAIVALALAVPIIGKSLLLYWLIPVFTWGAFASKVRASAEHILLINEPDPYRQTRTIYATRFERVILGLNSVYYHQAHHLYPTVPWFNLKKLNDELVKDEGYRERHARSDSYLAFIRECMEYRGEERPKIKA